MMRCTCCGNVLSEYEAESCDFSAEPLYCYDCKDEVLEEAAKNYPMWPSGWYGHCCLDNAGRWYTWENQSHV